MHVRRMPATQDHTMTRLTLLASVFALATPLITGHAADSEPFDPVVVKSAMLLSTFDRLDAECRNHGSMNAAQAAKVEKWRIEHAPDRVRMRLAAMNLSAKLRQQIEAAANTIVGQVKEKKADPCFAVAALLQTLVETPRVWRCAGSLLGFRYPSSSCCIARSARLVSQGVGTWRVNCVAAQGVPQR